MVYTGKFEQLERQLFHCVEEMKKGDPLAPIVVLAGSNLARIYLQRRLAEATGSHINVRFLTFMDLARTLAEDRFLEAGMRSLSREGQMALCRRLAKELGESDYFKPLAEFPGFPRALAATFTDLEDAGLEEFPTGLSGSPKLDALAALYSRYREGLRGSFYTGAALLAASAGCASSFPAAFQVDRLLIYGIYDLNPAQRALLQALSNFCELTLFVPEGYAQGEAGASSFARELGLIQGQGDIVGAAGGNEAATEFVSAPDPESEVRETLRRVMEFAAEGGSFGDVGILLRDDTYASLYSDTMDRLGIPYFSSFGRPLAGTPEARALLMFLDILARDMERFSVMEFLDYAPLNTASLEKAGHACTPGLWDLISRKAGIVKGMEQWKCGLAREAAALRRRAEREPENVRARERYEAAEGLRYMLGILGRIGSSIPSKARWSSFVQALDGAAHSLLIPSSRRESLLESMQELAELDRLSPQVTLAEFGQTLQDLWSRTREPAGRFQASGVNVCELMSARGLSFRMTVLPGLTSGVFPRVPRQDPLFLDTERTALNEMLGQEALVLKGVDRGEEEFLFRVALGSARQRLVLSYPRAECAGHRERIPSPFLLEMAEHISARKTGYSGIENTPGFRRIPASPAPVASPEAALSASEYDRCHALREARTGGDADGFTWEGISPFWQQRVAAEAATNSPVLSAFHLVPSAAGQGAKFGSPIAATTLERYARCPFCYFLQNILSLSPLEEPEEAMTISALDRGDVMHTILASFYTELMAKGMLPINSQNLPACAKLLEEHIRRELTARGDELITGLPLLWKLERQRMERELHAHLVRETECTEGMIPRYFELVFGRAGDSPVKLPAAELALEGDRKLAFRGRIDRIDISRDGRSFLVIDYKSGSTTEKPESLEGGEQLQLPIYLLAALELPGLSAATELQACYTYLSERADRSHSPYTAESAAALREQLAALLGTMMDLMEAGYYFVHPDDFKCKNCDYRTACPAERMSIFNRKSRDGLVASFRGLKDAG